MSKRNTVPASILLASALATLCLLTTAIPAQKGTNSTTGVPIRDIDVKLGRNPGGNAAQRMTDANGQINWGPQEPGSYYVEVIPPPKDPKATSVDDADYYVVEISGPAVVGGTKRMAWEVKKGKFVSPLKKNADATARTTAAPPVYSEKFQFDIGSGPPKPLESTIVRSKSNITNN